MINRRKTEGEEEGREYWCKILIGEVEVVEMGGGVTKEEVKTKAAEAAVRILKERESKYATGIEDVVVDEMDVEGANGVMVMDIDTVMECNHLRYDSRRFGAGVHG